MESAKNLLKRLLYKLHGHAPDKGDLGTVNSPLDFSSVFFRHPKHSRIVSATEFLQKKNPNNFTGP